MSPNPEQSIHGEIEECIDQIDEYIERLERYPPPVLAFALRTHLAGLLRAMLESHLCSHEQARQFVLELEQEVLGVGRGD